MYFKKTKLDGVFTHKLTKSIDFRGFVIENFQKKQISNFKLNFVQDTISFSNKNVLRGLHGDNSTWKLVSVIIGEAYIYIYIHIYFGTNFVLDAFFENVFSPGGWPKNSPK